MVVKLKNKINKGFLGNIFAGFLELEILIVIKFKHFIIFGVSKNTRYTNYRSTLVWVEFWDIMKPKTHSINSV